MVYESEAEGKKREVENSVPNREGKALGGNHLAIKKGGRAKSSLAIFGVPSYILSGRWPRARNNTRAQIHCVVGLCLFGCCTRARGPPANLSVNIKGPWGSLSGEPSRHQIRSAEKEQTTRLWLLSAAITS